MPIPVKATQLGFFGNKLRYENEEFTVDNEDQLGTWMHRLDGGPDRGEILDAALPQTPAPRPGRKATAQPPTAAVADPPALPDQTNSQSVI